MCLSDGIIDTETAMYNHFKIVFSNPYVFQCGQYCCKLYQIDQMFSALIMQHSIPYFIAFPIFTIQYYNSLSVGWHNCCHHNDVYINGTRRNDEVEGENAYKRRFGTNQWYKVNVILQETFLKYSFKCFLEFSNECMIMARGLVLDGIAKEVFRLQNS